MGLGAAPLWTSKCSYLTDTGTLYAESKSVHKDVIVNRFFGIFFMFFQSGLCELTTLADQSDVCIFVGQVWGNLISYLVLKPTEATANGTRAELSGKYNKCGADFSEQEYKGVAVTNQIDRKTVKIYKCED